MCLWWHLISSADIWLRPSEEPGYFIPKANQLAGDILKQQLFSETSLE